MISSAEEFVALRTSEDRELYTRAAHDFASEEVWLEVIDKYPDMKKWVVHNKTVPVSILERLVTDPDPSVRYAVASKRKASQVILEQLTRDPDESIRLAVACNPKAPLLVLQALVNDPWERVAEEARKRIEQRGQG